MLVTERAGRLRVPRDGVLDAAPIEGTPKVEITTLGGLLDVLPHPNFESNGLLYMGYSKAGDGNLSTTAVARGRLEGPRLAEPILAQLRQRIRDVRPGPDGLLYVLTDENPGVLLRIEPAE
jgi:glucose/arabinose dehydrogenase